MRALWIPLAVLAATLAVTLVCGSVLGRQCDAWNDRLTAAEHQIVVENWSKAEAELVELEESWDRWQRGLHTILEHDVLEEADSLLHQCLVLCREKDTAALRVAVSELRDQWALIREMQRLSIENVL